MEKPDPKTTEDCRGCRYADYGKPEIGRPAACWVNAFFEQLPDVRCAEYELKEQTHAI